MKRTLVAWLLAATAFACGSASVETYAVTGFVRGVDVAKAQVRIAHREIPGFMPAMTMDFSVADPALLDGLEPGAEVRFDLERSGSQLRITRIEKTGRVQEAGAGRSGVLSGPIDEAAPDFALVDQEGRPASLAEHRGKAVVLDFIFTRCPGPCGIQTASRVALQKRLPPELAQRTWLLSISLDPEYDTPERLDEYARSRGADLSNWSFLTGDPETVHAVIESYRVGQRNLPDGTFDHFLVTFLIDPDGRIANRYLGAEIAPDEMLGDLEGVLAGS
jgi:protein SCO1/2